MCALMCTGKSGPKLDIYETEVSEFIRKVEDYAIMVTDSAKTLALVIAAIKNLREMKGSTSREIMHYLSSVYNIQPNVARRQMGTALKRGVAYGILKKNGGHYILPTSSEMKLQEIAEQEVNLLDACRKSKRQKKLGCKCKKKRRRRKKKKYCRCKRKRSRRRRRRRSGGCGTKRRRKKKCRCGELLNEEDHNQMKRPLTPQSTDDSLPKDSSVEMPIDTYVPSEHSSVSTLSSVAD